MRAAPEELDRPHPDDAAGPDPPVDLTAALHAAQAGCERGFALLYRDLQPRLLRYAAALVTADAEDVTAETWLHVARDIHRFTGDLDGFRGWVSTICRNRAMDVARDAARRPAVPTAVGPDGPPAAAAEGAALDDLGTRRALSMILRLPPDQAEAVLLRAVVGLTAPAAGRVLGKRPGAVRVAAHRGLKRLAAWLHDEEGPRDGAR